MKPFTRVLAIIIVLCIALCARMRAAALLPIDYDEDDYLRAAQLYAEVVRERDWRRLPEVTFCHEHPALAKLAFGAAIAGLAPAPLIPERDLLDPAAETLPEPYLARARTLSVLLGLLNAALLAAVSPLAGLMLALHTTTIKYTSLVMLEALPALTGALAVIAFERWRGRPDRGGVRWLALSATAMGMTAASKYMYCVAGLAILADGLLPRGRASVTVWPRDRWRDAGLAMAWCLLAAVVFLAFNPYLWADTANRLLASVSYHGGFSQSWLVEVMDLPFYQPLLWLLFWVPWMPRIFPLGPDPLIAILALVGLPSLWRRRRVHALWLAIGMLFLFLWPTKWPQYVLALTVPWALSAAEGWERVVQPRVRWWLARRAEAPRREDESLAAPAPEVDAA